MDVEVDSPGGRLAVPIALQGDGLTESEVESLTVLAHMDGADAHDGEGCDGPIVIHADGVVECVACWAIRSAHHGPDSVKRCSDVDGQDESPGWKCARCG